MDDTITRNASAGVGGVTIVMTIVVAAISATAASAWLRWRRREPALSARTRDRLR